MNSSAYFSAKGICKAFGVTRALIDVSIDVHQGEIHGLIGENGSGKSTLSSIIAGAQLADEGAMFIDGEPYAPTSMVSAQMNGVSMILQEMGTIPRITVASNIFAGQLEKFRRLGLLDWKRINREANEALIKIGAPEIKAEMQIDSLNFEDRKIVEIARAMVAKPNLLIIDETTTALATKGRTIIYNLIREMHQENKAVLFISHDLNELMEICNIITVLRDGQVIDTLQKEDISVDKMRMLMIGRELQGSYYRDDFEGTYDSEIALQADNISLRPSLKNISLALHKGEILGMGGLSDCGMHELGRVLFGLEKPVTGTVTRHQNGEDTSITSAQKAANKGIAYISKDRDKESIIIDASIRGNIVLPSLDRLTGMLGFVAKSREKKLALEQIECLHIKCRDDRQSMKELSGGNKQKVAFSKWLGTECDIYILDCPTRGIDVGVKADMYKLMMDLKRQGKSIIMISEEMSELIGMSDRILLLRNGKLVKEIMRSPSVGEQDIIEHII